jgi:predicted Zn-dependent protease
MHLARNDMLVPGGTGRAQRQRGTVMVDEPPYGFFIAGSSVKTLNGVYIRRNVPRDPAQMRKGEDILLYYVHMDSNGATMILSEKSRKKPTVSRDEVEEDDEEDEDEEDSEEDHWFRQVQPPKRQWLFVDEKNVDRFAHVGDTIVPGAGTRWKHVHKQSGGGSSSTTSSAAAAATAAAYSSFFGLGGGSQIVEASQDDHNELPWQVIAILDTGILNQIMRGARYHKHRVSESVAGRGEAVKAPALTSLESLISQPGGWVYRVICDKAIFRANPLADAAVVSTKSFGDFIKAIELKETPAGTWLRMERTDKTADVNEDDIDNDEEDEDDDEDQFLSSSMYAFGGSHASRRFYNAEFREVKREYWTPLFDGDSPLLEKVEASDSANLGKSVEGESHLEEEKSESGASALPIRRLDSIAAEFLDAPFVPRLDGGNSEVGIDSALNESMRVESSLLSGAAATRAAADLALPVGAEVIIARLTGADSAKYNGCSGVVITPPSDEGRQGVRLNAPFSGKRLNCRRVNLLVPAKPSDRRLLGEKVPEGLETLARHARVLGLSLKELGLLGDSIGTITTTDADGSLALGFRVGDTSPLEATDASLRSALRDALFDRDDAAAHVARTAHSEIQKALQTLKSSSSSTSSSSSSASTTNADDAITAQSPDSLVRHGALGSRAASAARAAASTTSYREAESGAKELKELLLNELDRMANEGEGEIEGADALYLRLTLTLAYLQSGRDSLALSAASEAVNTHPGSPAAAFVLARALLRVGKRTEGQHQLSRASSPAFKSPSPGYAWAVSLASIALRAIKAAEHKQSCAMDAYDRGSLSEAATAYSSAISIIESCIRDDKHNRAALHANVAACLRRDKKPAEAVLECDAALALLPLYGRALFRRAASLLEAGKPEEAVFAFETLYRVDRSWPKLSEWLLRSIAAQRRGGTGGNTGSANRSPKRSREPAQDADEAASPGASSDDIAKFAAEKDHYIVLGVTVDATEKQLKAAYRMKSLKYHPDRAGASYTAAFQRVASAFAVLSDPEKRQAYDEGKDVKASRKDGRDDDDSEEEAEEHKQSLREEIERKYYPERYEYLPFGDCHIQKRKYEAQLKARAAPQQRRAAWGEEDD